VNNRSFIMNNTISSFCVNTEFYRIKFTAVSNIKYRVQLNLNIYDVYSHKADYNTEHKVNKKNIYIKRK